MAVGGEAQILVRSTVSCVGVGSGLFSGVVSAANLKLNVNENFQFDMEDETKPGKQVVEIQLESILDL